MHQTIRQFQFKAALKCNPNAILYLEVQSGFSPS